MFFLISFRTSILVPKYYILFYKHEHVRASKESVDAAKNMKDDTAGMHEDLNTFEGFIDGLREHLED